MVVNIYSISKLATQKWVSPIKQALKIFDSHVLHVQILISSAYNAAEKFLLYHDAAIRAQYESILVVVMVRNLQRCQVVYKHI